MPLTNLDDSAYDPRTRLDDSQAIPIDTDAIHDNVAAEIAVITAKATPVDADLLLIEDSAAANAKKRMTIGDLHAPYSLIDGTRAFTGVVAGIDPVASIHLATKEYVDRNINFMEEFFFTNVLSDIGGIYYNMLDLSTGGGESTFTASGLSGGAGQALTNWATLAGIPGTITLEEGVYTGHIHAERTFGNRSVNLYFEIWTRLADSPFTETLRVTSEVSSEITDKVEVELHGVLPSDVMVNDTDRIIIKWLADLGTGAPTTIVLYAEGTNASRAKIPTSTEILSHIFIRQDGTTPLLAPWAAGNDITGVTKLVVDSLTLDGTSVSSADGLGLTSIGGGVSIGALSGLVSLFGSSFKLTPSGVGADVLLTFDAFAQDGTLTYMNTEDEFRFSALVQATKLVATELYNASGDLKIMPDVQGDVVLFGDTDVADAAAGKWLYVRRNAPEGDNYLRFRISAGQVALLDSDAPMFLSSVGYIKLVAGNSMYLDLEDNAGAQKVYFRDSDKATIASIDSDGNLFLANPVVIAYGGSGQTTQQAAIDALTAVSGATDEYVLTKDTGSGNATWKVAAGGGSGDVTAAANLGDNEIIRGDGGAKGVQDSGVYIDDSGNLGLGQATPAVRLHVEEAGTAKANTDFMQLVNNANAADMDGTATSILFRQAYLGGTVVDMGRFKFETGAADWTSVASTRDGKLTVQVVHDGVLRDKLVIGGNVGKEDFLVNGSSTFWRDGGSLTAIWFAHADTAIAEVNFSARRSRGTRDSPTGVVDGDLIGAMDFRGYDGSSYQTRARIHVEVDGTVVDGSNAVPMSMTFRTGTTGSGSGTDRFTIDSSGDVTLETTGAHFNFGADTEYIVGSNSFLGYNVRGGALHNFLVDDALVVQFGAGQISLYESASIRGRIQWSDSPNMLEFGIGSVGAPRLQLLAATSSFVGGVLMSSTAHAAPATSAILELSSTTGAFLPPRMTTAQRNALTPVNGMLLYNETDGELNYRKAGAWVAI